ncbi:hypothetical protein PA08_2644 [Cutibacterium modestum P08]|nr:hypothetical protein PA08_2644 [Cutibacterium modestum P08]
MPVGMVPTLPNPIAIRGSKQVRWTLRERAVEHWCCGVV